MVVEPIKLQHDAEKVKLMNVIYILLLFWGGEMGIYVQTCMFNFQSQVLMDQINFF